MIRSVGILIATLVLITSCNKRSDFDEYALCHDDGRAKPIVALVPIINSSTTDLEWDLSSELSYALRKKLLQKGRLFLISENIVSHQFTSLQEDVNPFDPEITWVKNAFDTEEFVVFAELVNHSETPIHKKGAAEKCDADLNITMRLRIFDLRGSHPKVILQEMIQNNHFIPKQFTKANFVQVGYTADTFSLTPVGLAHTQLVKELSTRIEDYILLAKSK